jgi:rhamnose utilization protein RhaD (predicted bifunctional aldolase and dehydrogenase)
MMRSDTSEASRVESQVVELEMLRDLTHRLGSNPLLAQGSTGNTSIKLDGVLWIKASGRWMADARQNEILIPLDLADVHRECLQRDLDPAERYPGASLETAMHALLPHRVVLHVHCVNTIAWAVRSDARAQLQERLGGLRWRWVPYVESGLPLARAARNSLPADDAHADEANRDADIFVLGNHGLVIGAESCCAAEHLLSEVGRRLALPPRQAHPADYTLLAEASAGTQWDLPDDDAIHALATDATSRAILAGGLLYPCQAIFSNSSTPALFRSIACSDSPGQWAARYRNRPLLLMEGRGVLISRSMTSAECAMIGGLAQVVQRIPVSAPIRYLTDTEIANSSSAVAYRYRELANERIGGGAAVPVLSRAASGKSLAS